VIAAVDDRCDAASVLAPVTAALRAAFGTDVLPGLAPGLLVTDDSGWAPAGTLTTDPGLGDLLDAAIRRWEAPPATAAALVWKAYTYWLALPAVLGWAVARRVPLVSADQVLVRRGGQQSPPVLGLRGSVPVAVLPSDPLASAGLPRVRVVADESALLGAFRRSLLDAHAAPLLAALRDRVRLGARPLLGSLAAGVAYGVLLGRGRLLDPPERAVGALLGALGVDDLVELVPGADGRPMVQRRTCCLAFTLPTPKICAGCCIRP
jgi:hypothetical protein